MEDLRFLSAVFKYKRMLVLLCLSATVNAVVLTYVITEKYTASALILMRPQEFMRLTPPSNTKELLKFPLGFNIPFKAASQTYIEVIKSRTIAEKIVRALELDKEEVEPNWFKRLKRKVREYGNDAWALLKYGRIERVSAFEQAVAGVQDAISAVPTKDTYIFEVRFMTKHPVTAAAVANAAADLFVEFSREENRKEAQGAREFVEARLHESEETLETSRKRLRGFKESGKIVDLSQEQTARLKALFDTEVALEGVGRDIESKRAEADEIKRQIAAQPEFVKSSFTLTDNPLVSELKSQLARLEIDQSGLVRKYGPAHPEALSIKAKIGDAREKLNAEVAKLVSEETSAANTIQRTLLSNLVLAETRLESLGAESATLTASVAEKRAVLRDFPDRQVEISRLELSLGVAEDTYKLIKKEYEDARIREAERLSEIRIVSPAIPAVYPARPIKVYYAGVALALALVTAVAIAAFVEYQEAGRKLESAARP